MKNSKKKSTTKFRRWTEAEDKKVFKQVSTFPQNLAKCFILVSEDLGRTPGSVAYRWYIHISKDPRYLGFFTASSKHLSRNRKNGFGVPIKETVWQKFLKLINKL
jgi:hypothetical protein